MYSLVRIIFLLVIVALIAIYKKVRKRKFCINLRVVTPIFCIAFLTLLFVTPETRLIGFSSPKAAYNYVRSGDYESIAYGKQSALVVKMNKKGTFEATLILKQNDKWYITTPLLNSVQVVPVHDSILVFRIGDDRVTDVYYAISIDNYPIEEEGQVIKLNNNTALSKIDNFLQSVQVRTQYWFFCLDKEPTTLVLSIDGKDVFSYNLD